MNTMIKNRIKTLMMAIVMSGFLSACSSDPEGTGGYFEEPIDNNETPYIYPHPLGNSNSYIEMRKYPKVSTDNVSAFNYPYGNSGTHLNDSK